VADVLEFRVSRGVDRICTDPRAVRVANVNHELHVGFIDLLQDSRVLRGHELRREGRAGVGVIRHVAEKREPVTVPDLIRRILL
jgi:hypothetical protein